MLNFSRLQLQCLKHPLRIPLKLNLSNISMIKQLSLTIRLSLVCCSIWHMVVNTVKLAASQFSKINRRIFFWFQTVCSRKTQVTVEKNLSRRLRDDLVQLEGTYALQHHSKNSEVSWTNLWDKLQFVNSVKRLVFDLTKIPFLKRLIGISRLIVEVLNDQNLLPNQIWLIGFRVMSSFGQVVISQNELNLFGSVEKWITSKPGTKCVTLTTKCFVLAVAQDHILSVWRVLVDSDELLMGYYLFIFSSHQHVWHMMSQISLILIDFDSFSGHFLIWNYSYLNCYNSGRRDIK